MNIAMPSGVGAVIAIIVLLVAVVMMVVSQLDLKLGLMISGLAVARLLP